MRVAAVLAVVACAAQVAAAQPAADERAAALVSTDPIRCWWQSDAGAVTIGQSFSVMLTCAVIYTDAVQVAPDESRFGVATVQVAPFEILGGSHPSDARNGSRRFFQYQYTLRIIDPDVIGKDIKIPSLQISYKVRSRVNSASTLEGRELTYVMPPLPIRVLSMVPSEAADIRDGSEAGFAAVEALRFRASLFRIAATGLALIALIVGVWALAPWARMARKPSGESPHHIPDRAVIRELQSALTALKAEADRGWSDDLVVRALPLVRLVSSFAIRRPISQRQLGSEPADANGRLLVSHGVIRQARATISSSVTPDDLTRAVTALADGAATKRAHLQTLRDGLAAMTEAAYRQSGQRDDTRLDEALRAAIAVTATLAGEQNRLREWMSKLQGARDKAGAW